MKKPPYSPFIAILLAVLVVPTGAGRIAAETSAQKQPNIDLINSKIGADRPSYIEGEVLVKYKKDNVNLETATGRMAAEHFNEARSLEKKEELQKNNTSVLRIKDDRTVEEKIAEIRNDPNVEYVEPNYLYYASSTTPNDSNYSVLWGLNNTGQTVDGTAGTADADIDAPAAWDIATGSSDVVVAVIDTGVSYNHPDLAGNMVSGYDFVDDDAIPADMNGHGTHVAGTIGALGNNSTGVTGVNWDVSIMPLRVLDVNGSGTTADITSAVTYATANGADVINMSLGGTGFSQTFYDAISAAGEADIVVIAAAGNDATNNESTHQYPSDYDLDNIISVAATNQNDGLASFSNYGAVSVDVGAPGVNIYSTEGYRILDEDFEGVSLPAIGSNFSQSGDMTWGTLTSGSSNVLVGDYANWGSYQNDITSTIDSSAINISGKPNSYLKFDIYCDSELGYDGVVLYFWDGAEWDLQDSYSGLGSSQEGKSLASYANSDFKFRFVWTTDGSTTDIGCYLDNIKVVDSLSTSGSNQYLDGTSMATPHVAGLAALIIGYDPDLTVAQVKEKILETGDSLPALDGMTVTGKRINALAALQAVDITAPTVPATFAAYSNDSKDIVLNSTTTYSIEEPYFEWSASTDSGSGVAGYYVKFSTSSTADAATGTLQTGRSYTASTLATAGKRYLHVKAVDNEGNLSAGIKIPYTFTPPITYIIAGAKQGNNQVRIFKTNGTLIKSFTPYSKSLISGVNIATGDVNGDGTLDIVTSAREGGKPRIKIFNSRGVNLGRDFSAYPARYDNGVNIATGDIDGDSKDEIITALMSGDRPMVRIFDYSGGSFRQVYKTFTAYGSKYSGGATVAAGDLNDDGYAEIITSLTERGTSSVRVFKRQGGAFAPIKSVLRAYPKDFTGTVLLSVGDVNGDGKAEVITGVAGEGNPQVRLFKYKSQALQLLNTPFMAYKKALQGGASIATVDYNADGKEEIVTGAGGNDKPTVKMFTAKGVQKGTSFKAFSKTYLNGITVAAGRF